MPDERSLQKLRTVGRYTSWLLIVVIIAMVAITVLSAVCLIFTLVNDTVSAGPLDHQETVMKFVEGMVCGFFDVLLCYLAYQVFSSLDDCHSPFVRQNVIAIRRLSILSLIAFIVTFAVETTVGMLLGPGEYWTDFHLTYLVMGAVSYVFYLLFDYGSALQTESDEFL